MSVAAMVVLDRNLNHAVVVETKSAPVRVSPFDTAASETTVSEGQDVSIIGHHGDFLRVRDGQGRTAGYNPLRCSLSFRGNPDRCSTAALRSPCDFS